MKILVEQMKNQNPLDPLDNKEMASQLAQFSQLQQIESMNMSFDQILDTTRMSYANSLIGKNVSFLSTDDQGQNSMQTVLVEYAYKDLENENKIRLISGDRHIDLEDVIAVHN